ncbi:MAG: hypothetical protein ACR2ME_03230 [Acidimicrobiia bacterium]
MEVAAVIAYRIARSQDFRKETSAQLCCLRGEYWTETGSKAQRFIPLDDRELAGLLVKAAAGADVQSDVTALFNSRR